MLSRCIVLFLSVICLLIPSHALMAVDYLPDSSDSIIKYTGTLLLGDDTKEVTKTIIIHDSLKIKGADCIIHEEKINIEGKKEHRIRYYTVKDDGIYEIAEGKDIDAKPEMFAEPRCILKTPVKVGNSWKISYKDKLKKVNLKYTVINTGEKIEISGQKYDCVHLKATGQAKMFGLTIPMETDIYRNSKHGVVRQISKQTIKDTTTVTTLEIQPE